MTKRSVWLVSLLLVVIAASFGRLETAAKRPLWGDEELTLHSAKHRYLHWVYLSSVSDWYGDTPLLYPAVSWFLYRCLSPRWALRLTSVISGIATVFFLGLLGQSLFHRRVGLIAASLLALSVYHINYSQDARAYTLLACLTTAQFYFLVSYLRSKKRRDAAGWGISAILSLYAHHASVFYVACGAAVAVIGVVAGAMRRDTTVDEEDSEARGAPPPSDPSAQSGATDKRSDTGPAKRVARSTWSLIAPLLVSFAGVAILYLPGFNTFREFLDRPQTGEFFTLNLSARFFTELFGRWGNGSQWSVIYAILLLLGLFSVLRRRGLALVCLIWISIPFVVFALVPFAKFFDVRYLIASVPMFFLLVAEGISVTSRASACLISRFQAPTPDAPARGHCALVAAAICGFLLCLSVPTYLVFRQTETRCSDFFQRPEVLTAHNGFCEKHIILNSIHEPHSFLLKSVGDSSADSNR